MMLLLATGCDEQAAPDGFQEVVFDVSALFRTTEGGPCVSVAETLVLRVREEDGTEQTATRDLTAADTEVRIPVTVAVGTVEFEAEVQSNNGTRLYAGTTTARVGADGFSVSVPLEAVNAVLKACPDLVPLRLADDVYSGELELINRGDRATAWQATAESPVCDNVPCFRLDPDQGSVPRDDTVRIAGIALVTTLTDVFDVQINSPVGSLDVRFFVESPAPVARPDTVTVLEDTEVAVDVLANDFDAQGDSLTLISVGSALFGSTGQAGDLATYAAGPMPVWGTTSEDGFSYVADAGGRRAEGEVTVQIVPCFAFEARNSSEQAGVVLATENGVAATTRAFAFRPDSSDFVFASIDPVLQSNTDLGVYLGDAALEFDWSAKPVRYVRFDFDDNADLVNLGLNGGMPFIGPSLTEDIDLPPGVTLRIEDGKFGDGTRVVLEADAASPIERLLLGGGAATGNQDLLVVDDICFGLAPPSDG